MTSKPSILNKILVSEFNSIVQTEGCTKRTAVRLALVNCINKSVLKPGEYLPSEILMGQLLNVSLGTVQVALGQLQDIGLIERRRGDGSRVSKSESFEDSIWHFRFSSVKTGSPIRMINSELDITKTSDSGYWSRFLGKHKEYFCVSRKILMFNKIHAGAKMFIPIAIAPDFNEININELNMLNIRSFLEDKLKLKIIECKSKVSVCIPDKPEDNEFNLVDLTPHFKIDATAFSVENNPIYHQRVLVPVSDVNLEF